MPGLVLVLGGETIAACFDSELASKVFRDAVIRSSKRPIFVRDQYGTEWQIRPSAVDAMHRY